MATRPVAPGICQRKSKRGLGKRRRFGGGCIRSTGIANPYTFTGRRLDDETGLFYYRNRYYHAQLGRFVSRDPIGYEGGINLYEYVGNTPTNATDSSGLWRFVPGMGTLSGSFGPGDERNYGKASSQFQLSFHPDWRAFAANRKGTCCAQIKFVQIFYSDVTAIRTENPNRKWTLDPYRYRGTRPYYPDGIFLNPSKEGIGSSTFDGPYFSPLWRFARPSSISMDFETCAVCSKSKSPGGKKGIGDVFACVRWGHSFQIAGTILNAHVRGWKRYVESDIWTDSVFVLGGPPGINKNDPNHQFKDIAKAPSNNMKTFLKKYFP